MGGEATIWGFSGDFQVELLSSKQILHYYDDPPIVPADLECLRYIERDGERLYDEADLATISEKKKAERKVRMDAACNLVMTLPDEFLLLCEEVRETPTAVLQGFIADLCHLETTPYITNGSDERMFAEQYFERCGYKARVEWEQERLETEAEKKKI